MINLLGVIGLGLMGGSLCKGLKYKNFKTPIIAYDTDISALKNAKEENQIDYIAKNIEELIEKCDVIVVATHLRHFPEIFSKINEKLKHKLILTDLGSVKKSVQDLIEKCTNPNLHYIGVHPMTGSEKTGYLSSDAYLYENAYCFICPYEKAEGEDIEKVTEIFNVLGSFSVIYPPEEHDKTVAFISHLPHVLAATLINTVEENQGMKRLPFIGGGFKDSTRIAAGDSNLWKDIILYNKKNILNSLKNFEKNLQKIYGIIESEDKEKLHDFLNSASLLRKSLPQKTKDYISTQFPLYVSIPDMPGALAKLTSTLANINIKQIEILHSREVDGAIRLNFSSDEEKQNAFKLLQEKGYRVFQEED